MKISFFTIVIIIFSMGCTSQPNRQVYLSSLENIHNYPANTQDSLKIDSLQLISKRFEEKCEKEKRECFIHDMVLDANFKGGAGKFRQALHKNFKLPPKAKKGENKISVIIGTNNKIEQIKILKFSDLATKKVIEEVFKSQELNNWKSARIYNIPVKQEFEISIFVGIKD